MKAWIRGKVLVGDRYGTEIGFPTINLDPQKVKSLIEEGIYSAQVKTESKIFQGVLFFGPRLTKGETKNMLEIHILDFSQNLYHKQVEFLVGKFIRGVKNFRSEEDLKKEIKKDIKKVRKLLK